MSGVRAPRGTRELVGIVPAAGWARRSVALPCSKEIFPIGFHSPSDQRGVTAPKPACAYLLESMRDAGAKRAIVGLRTGKWDIPAHLADGSAYGLALAYTVLGQSPGVPWTVRAALRFAPASRVLFGFPDIVFRPSDALARMEQRQRERGAEVVLGLVRARRPEKMDMVEVGGDGLVRDLVIKPPSTSLHHTWILAVWTPAFSAFLDAQVRQADAVRRADDEEFHLGHVIRAALDGEWDIDALDLADGDYCDIGTPDELAAAVEEFG